MEMSHRQLQIPVQAVVSHQFMASWWWKGMDEFIQEAREGDKTTSFGTERDMDSGGHTEGEESILCGMMRTRKGARVPRSCGWAAIV